MSDILPPFLGALQASLSVLLIVVYGALAAQYNLLTEGSSKDLSKTCVRLLLPTLLFIQVGQEIRPETIVAYVPIFVWCILYNVVLTGWGILSVKIFKFPAWVTPAIAFNNTTALPVLLVQSLDSAGILDSLLMSSNDTPANAVRRATTYLLVNSVVANCLTFAVGPQMLNAHEEDAPDKEPEKVPGIEQEQADNDQSSEDPERQPNQQSAQEAFEDDHSNEQTSLLPERVNRTQKKAQLKGRLQGQNLWVRLPPWMQTCLGFLFQFVNASVLAAFAGLVVGLTPPLQKAFFSDFSHGGYLNAWLTVSLKNTGGLFPALQTFTVGIKLASALRDMKKDDNSGGAYPWLPSLFVEVTRHVLTPIMSILIIWLVATKTSWLAPDPILWFSLMIIPTGPPATKLTALADVSDYSEEEKMSISKFMAVSYIVSPVMAFAIVGSLKATQAAM